LPSAIAANIAARCDMDLSPGSSITPLSELARDSLIYNILTADRLICLDSAGL
jgi:hypothetical protein